MDKPNNQPITDAVYGKKAAEARAKKKPQPARPRRGQSVGAAITPHAAAALVALRAELQADEDAREEAKKASRARKKRKAEAAVEPQIHAQKRRAPRKPRQPEGGRP